MSLTLAVAVYLAAIGLPAVLLYRFHPRHWFWHVIALAAAVGLGFIPIPPELNRPGYDLVFGFVFVFLLVWGAGGLVVNRHDRHREKHA